MAFSIKTDDKPRLDQLMRENPQVAREIIATFVDLMEETLEQGWHELPQLFAGRDLTFRDMIKGILHGSLDLPDLNPDAYDALKEEVHPLSMLAPRRDYLNGGTRVYNWRNHFRLPKDAKADQDTIAAIFRKLLRYYKYVKVDDLAYALINNQIANYKSINQTENLPFTPALRYQQVQFGDLHVGSFFPDVGAFDLGEWDEHNENCPACDTVEDLWHVKNYKICPSCNAGYKVNEL